MTDTTSSAAEFAAVFSDDELIFDELVLDRPDMPAAPVVEATEPIRPRRTPRRGRDATGVAAETIPEAGITPPPSVSVPTADTEEPADPPAPVPQPDVGSAGFRFRETMLLAIVCLALFTSLASLGGLVAVGRTLAHAEADRARAEDERAALVRVPAMMKALDDASIRIGQVAARTPGPAAAPATLDDLHHAMDDLRLALSNRQPDGISPLAGTMHDGFSELGTRMDRLADTLDQVNRRLSASRPATPAAGRARPS